MDVNRQFLERVVVWPGDANAPGWINLHTHLKNDDPSKNGGKPFVVGWPFKKVEDFISRANWLGETNTFYDAWFCTSQQREAGLNKSGKPKAKRLMQNATWLRSIWLDIDIKPEDKTGKHYLTLKEAIDSLRAFRNKVGMPGPSALIDSGGGLHVYWFSDQPLTPDVWRRYADGLKSLALTEGLKCDTGLTTDPARILRVPGTMNHKYDPPRQVKVLGGGLSKSYNFETELSFLKNFSSAGLKSSTSMPAQVTPVDPIEPGADFSAPHPAFAALTGGGELQAGIEPSGPSLVDPGPVFEKCGFLGHALLTGGADYDNPLWNLSVLCTAFMENGNALAHEISKGHTTYTASDTQALYDRKVADRADRGIGYPSCSTIEGNGCKSCATCPLRASGKSPLNIRATPVGSTVTVAVTRPQSQAAQALVLPHNYDVDAEGFICEIANKTLPTGDVQEVWKRLFICKIDAAWAQKDPDAIHMHISTDGGNWRWATLRFEDWCGQGYEKKLALQKVKYNPEHKGRLEQFFMSFLAAMHKITEATEAVGFGWYRPKGPVEGFAYGGSIHRVDGTTVMAGMTDKRLQERFAPKGDPDPWYRAFSYITRQERPELECVVAVSFAAPLIELTGTTGAMFSCAGEKGAGKTFALEIGTAVWGHPKQTKETANSTEKGVLNRLGYTSNIACYWDEISDNPSQGKVLNFAMQTTGGTEGSRLTSSVEQREKLTWSTIVSMNTNRWFRDFVISQQADHGAMLPRMLEYWTETNPPDAKGQVPTSESDKALSELKYNYGCVGTDYAKYIATNFQHVERTVDKYLKFINDNLNPTKEDRMRVGLLASLFAGMELANSLPRPAGFHLEDNINFLIGVFKENVSFQVDANVTPTATAYADEYLAQFMKDRQMETIWTTGAPTTAGGRTSVPYTIYNPNTPRAHGYNIRFDSVLCEMWISVFSLKEWCSVRPDRDFRSITMSLKRNYGMTETKRVLAGGTPYKGKQERIFVINVLGHQDLVDAMLVHGGVDNTALGASTVATGILEAAGVVPDENTGTENIPDGQCLVAGPTGAAQSLDQTPG